MAAATSNDIPLESSLDLMKRVDESKTIVKALVDSGATSIPSIFIHPQDVLADLKSSSSTCLDIPLIDLSSINSPDHRPKIVQQIKDAAANWGIFQLINHGVPASVLDGTMAAVKAFHEQPNEDKMKYYVGGELHGRGVTFTSTALHRSAGTATWHDTLQMYNWRQHVNDEDVPDICREEVLDWKKQAKQVINTVLELMSEGLGLKKDKFTKGLELSGSEVIVGHYYPPCPQPDLTMGFTSHTDRGTITLLFNNNLPGLQVKHGDQWVSVKHVPGSLIVNIADLIEAITNGEYKSVEHRVLANSAKEPRVTIGMFYNVKKWEFSDVYGPLPELLSDGKPQRYRQFSLGDYIKNVHSKGIAGTHFLEEYRISN